MKKTLVTAIALFSIFLFTSCEKVIGTGPVETETRNLSNFTGVSSGFSGKVNIQIGNSFQVDVSAQRAVMNVLRTNVSGGVLYIDFKNNVHVRTTEEVLVSITMPLLDYVRLSGSGDINVTGEVSSGSFNAQVSGSGNINLQKLETSGTLDARLSGSGDINIYNGTAAHEKLQLSGSGGINFAGLTAATAEAHISGSGNIRVKVEQSLDARISGSGSIYYAGNPQVSSQISGSGKVKPI